MATMVKEDPSRPPWPACPSTGWTSGVDRLWGLPNGRSLSPKAVSDGDVLLESPPIPSINFSVAVGACNTGLQMETHGYYQVRRAHNKAHCS